MRLPPPKEAIRNESPIDRHRHQPSAVSLGQLTSSQKNAIYVARRYFPFLEVRGIGFPGRLHALRGESGWLYKRHYADYSPPSVRHAPEMCFTCPTVNMG